MKNNTKILHPALISLVILSACSELPAAINRGIFILDVEAGHRVDEGNFGNPTLNNALVQTAYGGQNGLILDLSRKFAKDVTSMVNFRFGSADLDNDAKDILRKQASWIQQFTVIKFRVYGHTDLVGSTTNNQSLGLRRANKVVAFLIGQGIEADRLEAVASFGETQPLIVTEGRERKNRRTVTEVAGFTTNYVGDDLDGKYAALIYQAYVEGTLTTSGLATAGGETPASE